LTEWDKERVSKLDKKQLENLRENAAKRNNEPIVLLCDEEIAARSVPKRPTRVSADNNEPVLGFHFVCDGEKGITRNSDGTIWSGTWVVDKRHAEHGAKIGSYVALHRTKAEPSYLQGRLKGWREAVREKRYGDEDAKTAFGVDFLIELTQHSYEWVGDGTGEKGYARGVLNSENPQAS
jgi:hypothetical protein